MTNDYFQDVQTLHSRCEWLLTDCKQWENSDNMEGMHRYVSLLTTELNFLKKLLSNPSLIKKEYIHSSNLVNLEAMHEAIKGSRNVKEILGNKSVPPQDDQTWMSRAVMLREHSVKVDIIAENGVVWIKVIARNAKAFRLDMVGLEELQEVDCEDLKDDHEEDNISVDGRNLQMEDAFAELPIFKTARDYLRSAEAHHFHFRVPLVVFAFMRMQSEDEFISRIVQRLREMGVVVYFKSEETTLAEAYRPLLLNVDPFDLTTASLNLDVSTALALISEMSHRPCRPDQVDGLSLKAQAVRELASPILPLLVQIFHASNQNAEEGKMKHLYMIEKAYARLKNIVEKVGGPNEKARFYYLFRNHKVDGQGTMAFDKKLWTLLPSLEIAVIPDAASERFRQLLEPPPQNGPKMNNGRKIRTQFTEFHAHLFGSGDHYKMSSVTGIQWMAQALIDSGLTGVGVITHDARSLAEIRMDTHISSKQD